MNKKSFTLFEVVIVIVIIGIMVTFGIPAYMNVVENSKVKICETNLQALLKAVDIYAMEHDLFPASLSQIPHRYIREAYKQVLEGKDAWKIELAYFIAGGREYGVAHATGFLRDEIAKGNLTLITCPSTDPAHTPAHGGCSYGINQLLQGMTYHDYKALAGNTPVIADCDSSIFSGLFNFAMRHKYYRIYGPMTYPIPYYLGITADGTIIGKPYSYP